MRNLLLAFTLLVMPAAAVLAQAPTAAASNSVTTEVSQKTSATDLPIPKTTVSHQIPDTYKGRVLTVGSGGGIVGKETAYLLLDDGRLFSRKAGRKTYTFIGKQTAARTKKVFRSVEDRCAIRKSTYSKPGNIYRFVQWKKGAELHKVAWAPGDKNVPAHYEPAYTGFMGLIPPAYL